MKNLNEKEFYNFKRVTIIAIVISSIGVLFSLARVFQIGVFLDMFYSNSSEQHNLFELGKESSEHVAFFRDTSFGSHLLMRIIYILTTVFILLSGILILTKKIFALRLLQISSIGFLSILFHKYFIDINIEILDALELLIAFLFLSFLFYHFLHLKKKGWFSLSSISLRTLAILNVQRGCSRACGFCTVPTIQGIPKSDSLKNIIDNAKQLASNKVKEIIIKGGNVAEFGKGEFGDLNHEHTFFDLMEAMDKIGGVDRFRFSLISTPLISEKTLTFFSKSIRLSPHFSIGMISGSNDMLKLIPRAYKREQYEKLYNDIKKLMPHAYISVDIIVGFPGETNELFEETYSFLKKQDISYINVWAYLEREDAPASKIKEGIVSKDVRIKRRKIINELSTEKLIGFYKSQLGSERTVLFEIGNHDGFIHGYTENHIKVKTTWFAELENTVEKVKLTKIDNKGFVLFDFLDYKLTDTHDSSI